MPSRLGLLNTPTTSLQIEVRPRPRNVCPWYDIKQSDSEVPVMLELWGMWSTPSLPSLPGPLWPGVVTPGRVLSIEISKNRNKLCTYAKLNGLKWNCLRILNWIVWNKTILHSNERKQKTILRLNWIILNRTVYMCKNRLSIK